MADFPVKWFSSDMGGAPVLSDQTPGEMIALMKACLSTGFNLVPIDGMEFDSGTGLATVNLSTGHGFLPWQVIEISGADQAGYNGEHRVVSVGTGWLTFAPDAAPSAGAATGDSMEIKASPSKSWEFIHEDAATYQASFRSTMPDATDHVVIMTDDDPTNSDVTSTADCVNMTVAEIYNDLSDYQESISQWWPASHRYWNESYAVRSYGRKDWTLITNGKLIYLALSYGASGKRAIFVLGNFDSVRPADAHHFILNGLDPKTGWSSTGYDMYNDFLQLNQADVSRLRSISRKYSQVPESTSFNLLGYGERIGGSFDAPNPADNGFHVASGKIGVREELQGTSAHQTLRGYLPGIVQPLCTVPFYDMQVIDDVPGLDNRPIIFMLATVRDYGNYESGSFTDWSITNNYRPYLIGFHLDHWS
ncbi:hypothetical protein [Cobetia amphilecti]|uniref:Uncharacterized protein n=1 Tax=Cobetia amphilecti TaxID=1055104 RepID=A0AAP4TXC8_9GAMM|nr:hypothetical protein [Cobetia amphilecti]MDO6671217.1 hypothetical protein [Cobetia amphilecti]